MDSRASAALLTLIVSASPLCLARSGAEGVSPDKGYSWSGLVVPAGEQIVRDADGKLPLAFVPNADQTDGVHFSAQAGGATFYFTQEEAIFAFRKGSLSQTGGIILRLAFLGGNPETRIEGQGLGPTYERVVYRDLWPGIDLVFRGADGQLKYEFLLRPRAKIAAIRLAFRGAEGLSLDRDGNLLVKTPLGTLTDARPIAYQELGGERVPVESRFLPHPDPRQEGAYGFAVGAYDSRQPLVIDPGLYYSLTVQ
jgi:hypothetical protein